MRAAAALCAVLVALAAPARADRDRALEIYERGKKKYSAGDFERAIELFEAAYEEDPAPAYLFNIAQAYRQLGDCAQALSFYKRFIKSAPEAGAAPAVEERIAELEKECGEGEGAPGSGTQSASGADPASGAGQAGTGDSVVAPAPVSGSRPDPAASSSDAGSEQSSLTLRRGTAAEEPARLVAAAEAGAAFFDIGDVVLPVSATLRLGAAYPWRLGPVTLEPGALAELSTMPYEEAGGDSNALITTLLVNVGASYPVAERLRVGGEAGAGLLLFSSLEEGNPFTRDAAASGTMTTFAVRVGASAEYRLVGRLALSVTPAFAYAGAPDELRGAISSVTRFEILGGVRYRL